MDDRFHLFVADSRNDCVRHFSAFGRHLGDFGRESESDGDAHRDKLGMLHGPAAVAVHRDTLIVAGGDKPRRRAVQRLTRDGRVLGWLRSTGDPEAEFGAPRGVWADANGVLVADTRCGRLQRFRGNGAFVACVPLDLGGEAARPVSVARTQDGRILVVDAGDRPGVRVVDTEGRDVAADAAGDLARHAEQPLAVSIGDDGAVYLLDRDGVRVQRFAKNLTFVDVVVDLREHLDGLYERET